MSLNKSKATLALLIIFFTLFINPLTVSAAAPDTDLNQSMHEQGGIWSNMLRPYDYYPNGLITMPEPVAPVQGIEETKNLVSDRLFDFISSVITGKSDTITGVYAENVLAYPVVQQPAGSAAFVSNQDGVVTQFALAAQYGNVGLLAHNYMAGDAFYNLSLNQDLYVVYGDGETARYVVTAFRRFQALQPYSPYSEFIDLDTRAYYTASSLFYEVFGRSETLVLQTCIAAEGVDSWGRLFVIAERVY